MSYKTKEQHALTKAMKARDDQLSINQNTDGIFTKKDFIYLIIGKRGSGKSSLLLNLLSTKEPDGFKKAFDYIFFVSPTARADSKLDDFRDDIEEMGCFYDDFNDDIMKEIMEKINDYRNNWKKKGKPRILFIGDDIMTLLPSGTQKKKATWNKFVVSHRHLGTSIVILGQRFMSVPSLFRSQIDIVSYFEQSNKNENKLFCDSYDIPEDILEYATKDPYSFLTVSFMKSKPKYYKMFDEIERN